MRRSSPAILVPVLVLCALLGLTACDALDAALGDTDGDGRSEPQAFGDTVRGEAEDWLRTVCGEDADVETVTPENDEYSSHRVEQHECHVAGAEVGDPEMEEYEVVAALYDTDPRRDLVTESDSYESGDGRQIAYAYGETRDGWAVVWLIPDHARADVGLLEPLEDDGFDVGQVH